MEKVIVLGLSGCSHCEALQEGLKKEKIPFKLLDVDLKENSSIADRMEALLKTENYPIIIIEKLDGAVYLYRVNSINEVKESPIAYATKIGCATTDSMVAITKKYIK
jgi:glutaredoxin